MLPLWKSGCIFDHFSVDIASKCMRKFELEADVGSFMNCGNRSLNDDSALFAIFSANRLLLRKRGAQVKISTLGYGKQRKFAELVLYISSKLDNDQYLGGVKLNKVLYFSDFTCFGLHGRTITGMEYQHLPEGPAPRAMFPIQQRMVQAGILRIDPTPIYKHVQNRPRPLRDADMSYFSEQEIAIVDRWIERLRPMTASQVSDFSHETFGWMTTVDGETIDPRTVFIAWKTPSASDIARGQELAKKYGLAA